MRTLAIGDIHGCYRSLSTLESYVAIDETDRIVTLGDHVDRGPDTKSVIEWLLSYHERGQLVALRGNHEVMMLSARESAIYNEQWLACGGDAVLDSYAINSLDDFPKSHWEFLAEKLRSFHEIESHFFVHANAYADLPLDDQPDYMLYWESFGNSSPHMSHKTMVCGHTAQRSGVPLDVGHAVCIDTRAYGGGWLTCLDVDTGFCWQANEAGKVRSFWLDEGPE